MATTRYGDTEILRYGDTEVSEKTKDEKHPLPLYEASGQKFSDLLTFPYSMHLLPRNTIFFSFLGNKMSPDNLRYLYMDFLTGVFSGYINESTV